MNETDRLTARGGKKKKKEKKEAVDVVSRMIRNDRNLWLRTSVKMRRFVIISLLAQICRQGVRHLLISPFAVSMPGAQNSKTEISKSQDIFNYPLHTA